MVKKILIIVLLFSQCVANAQSGDSTLRKKRLKPLVYSTVGAYGLTLVGLNALWYSDFERESFHFFNDNAEWKQMDKVGHFYSAFHLSHTGYKGLRWAGVSESRAMLWGSLSGLIIMTPIEILDGFSSAYGASTGDIIANTAGSALFWAQQAGWGEVRIHPKFSFRQSGYAQIRPKILGSNFSEELLKDYNGQSYWLSFDLSKFNTGLPKWLNLAIGYGASGMVYASDAQNMANGFTSRRRFFLGFDLDLHEYRSSSKALNTLIYLINLIHIPAPTIEVSDQKFRFHFLK